MKKQILSGVIVGGMVALGLILTKPTMPAFDEFIKDRLAADARNRDEMDEALAAMLAKNVSNLTARDDHMLFSVFRINANVLELFGTSVKTGKFLGIAGVFVAI